MIKKSIFKDGANKNLTHPKNKKGISLIVLVITIIVMIILAAAIIVSISNSGIVNRSNEAVEKSDEAQMKSLVAVAWSEAHFKETDEVKDDAYYQKEVKNYLLNNGITEAEQAKYEIIVTTQEASVSKKTDGGDGDSGSGGNNQVPEKWSEYVVAMVDGVPIPKGFAASPYGADEANDIAAENKKNSGLVIYELDEDETTMDDESQLDSWTGRNQYVWVPVNDFETEFVRRDFINQASKVLNADGEYNSLGTNYWEVLVNKETNLPLTTLAEQGTSYMSPETLVEVQAMYESVKEYGGFYIARYEAGIEERREYYDDEIVTGRDNVYSRMNKLTYSNLGWSVSKGMNGDTDAAVEAARSVYKFDDTTNVYGVVSTLIYGVQWDRTVQWLIERDVLSVANVDGTVGTTSFGNYKDHKIESYSEVNTNAQYATLTSIINSAGTYATMKEGDTKGTSDSYVFTTGALKAAKLNNIYDMAGNVYEWTMEGYSSRSRSIRGGACYETGTTSTIASRGSGTQFEGYDAIGFRTALYIKKSSN